MIMLPCGHCICQKCTENSFNSVNHELKPSIDQFIQMAPSQGLKEGERAVELLNKNNNDEDHHYLSEQSQYSDTAIVHDLDLYTYPVINIIQEINNTNNEFSFRRSLPKITSNPSINVFSIDELHGFTNEATDTLK